MDEIVVVNRAVDELVPYARNARVHPEKQIDQLARSIARYGFLVPVVVDADGGILSGHGRIAAAKKIGLVEVPTVSAAHLTPDQRREYILADNRIAENAEWDRDILRLELADLHLADIDLPDLGFDEKEIKKILREPEGDDDDGCGDTAPAPPPAQQVTRPGDVWIMGDHVLMCGDSTKADMVATLCAGGGSI